MSNTVCRSVFVHANVCIQTEMDIRNGFPITTVKSLLKKTWMYNLTCVAYNEQENIIPREASGT